MKHLVLLHGWAMHSKMWGDFSEQLLQHYRVTLIDLPLHNNLDAIADAVVAEVGDEPFYLLGWSFGGTVALKITERYANRVQGLILLASTPCFTETESWAGTPVEIMNAFAQQLHNNPDVTLQRFLTLQVQHSSEYLKEVKARFKLESAPKLADLETSFALLQNSDLRSTLQNVMCPVAMVLSNNDAIVPIAVHEQLHVLKPNLNITVLKNAGHIPFVTQPENCLNAIHAFFDGIR